MESTNETEKVEDTLGMSPVSTAFFFPHGATSPGAVAETGAEDHHHHKKDDHMRMIGASPAPPLSQPSETKESIIDAVVTPVSADMAAGSEASQEQAEIHSPSSKKKKLVKKMPHEDHDVVSPSTKKKKHPKGEHHDGKIASPVSEHKNKPSSPVKASPANVTTGLPTQSEVAGPGTPASKEKNPKAPKSPTKNVTGTSRAINGPPIQDDHMVSPGNGSKKMKKKKGKHGSDSVEETAGGLLLKNEHVASPKSPASKKKTHATKPGATTEYVSAHTVSKAINPVTGSITVTTPKPKRLVTDDGDDALPSIRTKPENRQAGGVRHSSVTHKTTPPGAMEVKGIDELSQGSMESGNISEPTAHIVAELAPGEEDVADRVARQVTTELTERLRIQLNQQSPPPANTMVIDAVVAEKEPDESDVISRTWLIVGAVACCVIVLGGILGAVLAVFLPGPDPPAPDPTAEPTTLPPVTLPPTTVPPTNPRRIYILQSLGDLIAPDEESMALFDDPSSPQDKALQWLSEDDDYSADPELISPKILLERYVLAVLYFSTNGPNWLLDFPYLDETSNVCDWNNEGVVGEDDTKGVYCTSSGDNKFVSYFRMHDLAMTGPIPWELSLLEHMYALYLEENSLRGTIPTELGTLTALMQIWVHENMLTGQMPGSWGPDMEELRYTNNLLSGTIPSELADAPKLVYLQFAFNNIHGSMPTEIGLLPQLFYIDLEANEIEGTIPTQLGLATTVEYMYLEKNLLTGTLPSALGNLNDLQVLSVYGNAQMTGTVPEEYSSLSYLRTLALHDTAITGSLDFSFCPLDNPSLDIYADCAGESPEIECSCCYYCCAADGEDCEENVNPFPTLAMELLTDAYPTETSFTLVTSDGDVIWQEADFEAYTLYNYETQVDRSDCTTLSFSDSFGDGLLGGYVLLSYDEVIAGNVSEFGTGFTWSVGDGCL